MRLEIIKNTVTSKVARQILIGRKHSPTLLFAGGVVGVGATVVLACRATLKLDDVISEAERAREAVNAKNLSDHNHGKQMAKVKITLVKDVVKLYTPAIGFGVVSISALTGSHVVLSRRNIALTAAYKAVEESLAQYRERVREEFGEEKELEIRRGSLTELSKSNDSEEYSVGKDERYETFPLPLKYSQYARFFDELNENWQRCYENNLYFIVMQQNYANDKLHKKGHVFLNEVYDLLGIERTKAGSVVGWVLNSETGDNQIDFGIYNPANEKARDFVNGREPAILLDFNVDGLIFDKIEKKR